jgi:death-on-curing protein
VTALPTHADTLAICRRFGWHEREPGALLHVLSRPAGRQFGVELFPGVHAKAAALMDTVNRLHPLVDGNKRLSWILVLRTYQLAGLHIEADDDQAEVFVLTVAGPHLSVERIAEWLADHCQSGPSIKG